MIQVDFGAFYKPAGARLTKYVPTRFNIYLLGWDFHLGWWLLSRYACSACAEAARGSSSNWEPAAEKDPAANGFVRSNASCWEASAWA